MALLHYIDNEVPDYGGWNAVVQLGSSTIVQSEAAAFPERGSLGLRATAVGSDSAYVQKNGGLFAIARCVDMVWPMDKIVYRKEPISCIHQGDGGLPGRTFGAGKLGATSFYAAG